MAGARIEAGRPVIKRFLPRTLFGRALLIIVTPVVLLQVIATFVFYERHWDTVTRRMATVLAGEVSAIIDARTVFVGDDAWDRMFAMAQNHLDMSVSFEPGARLPTDRPPLSSFSSIDRQLPQALGQTLDRPFRIDRYSFPGLIEIQVQLDDGVLRVLTIKKRVWSSTTYIFVMWMVGASLVLLGIAILFLRNQIRPIRRLAKAADDFGKGREVGNFKPEGAAEVRQAATAFLRMRQRIGRQIRQRTEMLAGVSHDLRTPLTRMKLELAMLGENEQVAALTADVGEMQKMVEDYLAFARGQEAETAVDTDVAAILREIVSDARRQGGDVDLRADGELVLPVRPNAMKRCLTNLVENARRHAGRTSITAAKLAGQITITIDDDGPGIPADHREAVFRPFYRLDRSRNPKTGGSGLGLTIARDVVRSHGGDLVLGDAPAGGLRASISLPL